MRTLLGKKHIYIGVAVLLILTMIALLIGVFSNSEPTLVTTTAESGPVRQLVSISGIAKAKEKADLGFAGTGIVSAVLVEVGQTVEAGEVLAILQNEKAESDRLAAMANLRSAIASRGELITGPTESNRATINETVQLKRDSLATTIAIETEKVAAAKRALLSEGLFAFTDDDGENATPPTITGSYSCEDEGTYTIELYASGADSGHSLRLSGIETGTYPASSDQPIPFGDCGLRLQLDPDSRYSNSVWTVEIPNTKSEAYTVNKNAYDLTVIQAGSAIDLAKQEVALAEADAADALATPRSEALIQADAAVEEAQARVAGFESDLADRVLRAPFAGTITSLDIKPGETVTNEPVMTLITKGAFEITARVPEIDVGKIALGQTVELLFDAKNDEVLTGEISFISLEATEIDGVAYFDTYITLPETPPWMRGGLNADIDIIIAKTTEGVRIPKRFLIEDNGTSAVLRQNGTLFATTTVDVLLRGNDGFVAVTGLSAGDVVVAP